MPAEPLVRAADSSAVGAETQGHPISKALLGKKFYFGWPRADKVDAERAVRAAPTVANGARRAVRGALCGTRGEPVRCISAGSARRTSRLNARVRCSRECGGGISG